MLAYAAAEPRTLLHPRGRTRSDSATAMAHRLRAVRLDFLEGASEITGAAFSDATRGLNDRLDRGGY